MNRDKNDAFSSSLKPKDITEMQKRRQELILNVNSTIHKLYQNSKIKENVFPKAAQKPKLKITGVFSPKLNQRKAARSHSPHF